MKFKKYKKIENYSLYLFIEFVLVLTALIFVSSMIMDIILKINKNKSVMDLNNYISIEKEDINSEELDRSYYKNTTIRDSETGKDYNVIFISKKFLDMKIFKVSSGLSFDNNITEREALVGENLNLNIDDNLSINNFLWTIDIKVKGILSKDELLWLNDAIVPYSLNDCIIILDRNLDCLSTPANEFLEHPTNNNFMRLDKFIMKNILDKQSSIYISLLFVIVIIILALNSINLIMSLILKRKSKEFAIKYALGSTPKDIFKETCIHFYTISLFALIASIGISFILQVIIPRELGYTFNIISLIVSIIIFILTTLTVILKVNKQINKYSVSSLLKRGSYND